MREEQAFKTLKLARQMRHEPVRAEKLLWDKLRNRTLSGYKFSRQVPIGIFIADFVCREHRLVIEVDGATHSEEHKVKRDERRELFITSQGYKIHRVWNQDIYDNMSGVLETILLILEQTPHPPCRAPSPQRGEGR